jgi:hypothetical protein
MLIIWPHQSLINIPVIGLNWECAPANASHVIRVKLARECRSVAVVAEWTEWICGKLLKHPAINLRGARTGH